MSRTVERAVEIFKKHGGILQTSMALGKGIHPRTLYGMRDDGIIERLCQGTYRLSDLPPLSNPDLTTVSLKIPKGVICLISALSFHEITTEIPHAIYVAIQRRSKCPQIDYPPVRVFQFSGKAFSEGIQTHRIDGKEVKIYCPEKTIVDCFKYRNKIGMNVPLEALKFYWKRKRPDLSKLLHFASICRVSNIMRPYLETLT
jgi:predicted transcriptional regulator of viral defense system